MEPIVLAANVHIRLNSFRHKDNNNTFNFIHTRNIQKPLEPIGFPANVQLGHKSFNYIHNQQHVNNFLSNSLNCQASVIYNSGIHKKWYTQLLNNNKNIIFIWI